MTSVVMAPDERALRGHLRGGGFQSGAAAGNWRLICVNWPLAMVAVSAAVRGKSPAEFVLRFELGSYPHTPPTGGLWDTSADASLPVGGRPKGERSAQLFRTDGWQGGATAMYAPWDRMGLQAHPDWAHKYPHDAWNPTRDLSFILSKVHEILNADDYLGI
jgi:hypothetical protein